MDKIPLAITTLLASVGAKYIHLEYEKDIESILHSDMGRLVIIFSIVYTSTKDWQLSIIISIIFFIMLTLLPKYNDYYALPKKK